MESFLILDLTDFSAASMVLVTVISGEGNEIPGALKYKGREWQLFVPCSKTSLPLMEDSSVQVGE